MREILFRAKRKDNGEWVEGYFVIGKWYLDEKERYAILPIDLCFYPHCEINEWIEIAPKTLCQYTGLKDKDGNRIWENDIVRCNRREKEAKYKVVWDKTYADFRIEKLNGLGIMPICIEEGNAPVFGRHYECIGNTFDNPELLKGDQSYADL